MAILQRSSGPELLLQKQFRPPISKVVIEVPAGLVDEGESAEESAVRELREETGYVGIAAEVSPVMYNGMFDHIHFDFVEGERIKSKLGFRPRLLQYELKYGPCQRRHVAT